MLSCILFSLVLRLISWPDLPKNLFAQPRLCHVQFLLFFYMNVFWIAYRSSVFIYGSVFVTYYCQQLCCLAYAHLGWCAHCKTLPFYNLFFFKSEIQIICHIIQECMYIKNGQQYILEDNKNSSFKMVILHFKRIGEFHDRTNDFIRVVSYLPP